MKQNSTYTGTTKKKQKNSPANKTSYGLVCLLWPAARKQSWPYSRSVTLWSL